MPIEPIPVPTEVETEDSDFNLIPRYAETVQAKAPKPVPKFEDDDDDTSAAVYFDSNGIQQERSVPDIIKPWMKHHKFVLVRTLEEVRGIVDAALQDGHCSLDLECEGLDSRIFYRPYEASDPLVGRNLRGKPYTKHKIVGFCMSIGDARTGYYIPIRHQPQDGGPNLNVSPVEGVEAEITRLCLAAQPTPKPGQKDLLAFREFETPPRVIIDFWHAAFDQEFLYPITGIDYWHPDGFEDGNLAAFCKYSGDKNLSLKDKSSEMLRDPEGHPYEMIKLKELFPLKGSKIEFQYLAPDEPGVIRYGCSDGICTRLLCSHPDLVPLVKEKYSFTYRLEKQVAQVKRVMERNRVRINRARILELREQHRAARDALCVQIEQFAHSKGFLEFSPGSPKQLSDMLFSKTGLDITLPGCGPEDIDFPNGKPPMNEKSQQYKTGADVLNEMTAAMGDQAPPILKWIVQFREEDKMLGTYLDKLAENPDEKDELRFQFKQTGAATGRFSAPAGDALQGYSGVPIHGIPSTSDLRTCFMARDGYTIVKCDYAGEELRIVANLSGEQVWIKEFLHGTGDLHTITARAFFGKSEVSKEERKMGKVSNFALVYGGGPSAIMRACGCDRMEGRRRKQAFDRAMPIFARWVTGQHARVKKELGVWTAFGRWMAIPDANSVDGAIRSACERHSTNYVIQGSGADILKISMVILHKNFYQRGWLADDSVRILLNVHDEIVFEIRHDRVCEAVPVIVNLMESPSGMVNPKYSPKWPVRLVTEPLVGPTWGTGYPCERAVTDHKLKEGDVLVNGFVYGTIRTVDLGKETPGNGEVEHWRDEKAKKLKIRILDPHWLNGVASDVPVTEKDDAGPEGGSGPPPAPAPAPPVVALPTPPVPPASPTELTARSDRPGGPSIATMNLRLLTKSSIRQVRMLCTMCFDNEHGVLLCLMDPMHGQVVVDPNFGIRVDIEWFADAMRSVNLSDGRWQLS